MTFTQERIRGGNYVPVVTVNGKRHVLHAKGFPTRTAAVMFCDEYKEVCAGLGSFLQSFLANSGS